MYNKTSRTLNPAANSGVAWHQKSGWKCTIWERRGRYYYGLGWSGWEINCFTKILKASKAILWSRGEVGTQAYEEYSQQLTGGWVSGGQEGQDGDGGWNALLERLTVQVIPEEIKARRLELRTGPFLESYHCNILQKHLLLFLATHVRACIHAHKHTPTVLFCPNSSLVFFCNLQGIFAMHLGLWNWSPPRKVAYLGTALPTGGWKSAEDADVLEDVQGDQYSKHAALASLSVPHLKAFMPSFKNT